VAYCQRAKVLLLRLLGQEGGELALAAALLLLLLGRLQRVSQMCLLQPQKQPAVALSPGLLLAPPLLKMLQQVKEAETAVVNRIQAAAAVVMMRCLQKWKPILAVVVVVVTARTTYWMTYQNSAAVGSVAAAVVATVIVTATAGTEG
jgi:hypothetical protein